MESKNIDPELIMASKMVIDDPRLDIEAFLDPNFDRKINIKCTKFITENFSGVIGRKSELIDTSIIDALIKEEELGPKKYTFETIAAGYEITKKGEIGCVSEKEIQSQNGIGLELFHHFGNKFVNGKGFSDVSLPVRVLENR